MTYRNLFVHLALGQSNATLLRVAADLSGRFDARVIGIAAYRPAPLVYSDGLSPAAFVIDDRPERDEQMAAAEATFAAMFADRGADAEWRSASVLETVADYVARQSRSADLILTSGSTANGSDSDRGTLGDIVLRSGRPVLVVPHAATATALDRVVVAWKDTREARRAAADAVPLMQHATHTTVVALAPESDRAAVGDQLSAVCDWLATHGIVAQPHFAVDAGGDDGAQLAAACATVGADVVVAGAYGHSRLREWAFGGVTRGLLAQVDHCVLLSH